jgi:tight adherence protein C
MPILIALVVFVAVALAVVAVMQPKDDPVARRIRGESGGGGRYGTRHLEGGIGRRVFGPAAQRFGEQLARVLPHRLLERFDRMLVMANSRMPVAIFLSVWAGSTVFGILLWLYIIGSSQVITPAQAALLAVVLIGLFALMPYVLLRNRVKRRQKRITRALPDGLDLLVTGVEAGLGVDAAFVMVTEKTAGPLSEVFTLYLRQVGLGRARREAFLDVAQRTGVPDLIRLAASVAQAEQMGTVLGDVLRVQAQDLRMLRRQRAQEAAQRAPVLMTIPMASCFLPAMAAVVIIPSGLNIMAFFTRARGGLP